MTLRLIHQGRSQGLDHVEVHKKTSFKSYIVSDLVTLLSIYQTRLSDCADASNIVRVSHIEDNMMLKPSLPGLHLTTRMVTISQYHIIPQRVAVFTDMLSS